MGRRPRHRRRRRGRRALSRVPSAHIAAYFFPDAVGPDIDLICDLSAFFFLFDDGFTVPAGASPDVALAACDQLLTVLSRPDGGAGDGALPIVAAFADAWEREREGMSATWCRRAAHEWRRYLYGHYAEVADRRTRARLSPREHLATRRDTLGFRPTVNMGERVGRFEMPLAALHHSRFRAMLEAALDHVLVVNEIYSLDNDETTGDHNLVHCVMHAHDRTRAEAIADLVHLADAHAHTLAAATAGTNDLCHALGLDGDERRAVRRWVATLCDFVRGNHDWGFAAGRYRAP
ncbi:terpene synthase family protein [Embleya hyalina]|uniref:Germacradienol/geosmin synthase n=1 Tax=Embleya hyalina TaxID=516124 RepID=A0A401Z6W2_9ACTN|nr:hypothetical protein [Embleya hyalina]GCE02612.1 germacradienol/geosmin synthase [Embleya hyalina]